MKKLVFCLMLVALSMPAYAVTVIGNWENAADPCARTSGDGWCDWNWGQAQIGTLPNERYEATTIGATNGNNALKMTLPTGWGQYLALHNYQCALPFPMADLLANTQLKIDITYDSGSWAADTGYAAIYSLSLQTAAYGWQDVGGGIDHSNGSVRNGVVFTDTLNPNYAGYLPMTNVGTPGTTYTGTWTWDYSAVLPGGSYTGNHISVNDTYVNLIFAFNSNGSGGSFIIDNVRLDVPEPATIAMLCLGGLALLKKRLTR